MNWKRADIELPDKDKRVICYSPVYESETNNQEMLFRIMAGNFVKICTEVTHWSYLEPPKDK